MPRFKPVDHGLHLLAIDLSLHLHPGSFEHALHHPIAHAIALIEIKARHKNEHEGAAAYAPQDRAAARDHQLPQH